MTDMNISDDVLDTEFSTLKEILSMLKVSTALDEAVTEVVTGKLYGFDGFGVRIEVTDDTLWTTLEMDTGETVMMRQVDLPVKPLDLIAHINEAFFLADLIRERLYDLRASVSKVRDRIIAIASEDGGVTVDGIVRAATEYILEKVDEREEGGDEDNLPVHD